MKKAFTPLFRSYLSEVLGVQNYLCLKPIYALRTLQGEPTGPALAVVFKAPSPSQQSLLKKIMASINVFKYSLLEIKDHKVLNQLILNGEIGADFIFFFGEEDLVQQKLALRQEKFPPSSDSHKGALKKSRKSHWELFCPLEDLEGNSIEAKNKKRQVWEQLKKCQRERNV